MFIAPTVPDAPGGCAERQQARSDADVTAGHMSAGLAGTSGFAAIPTTALDLPLVQRLRRSPRFRVRVPVAPWALNGRARSRGHAIHLRNLLEFGQELGRCCAR